MSKFPKRDKAAYLLSCKHWGTSTEVVDAIIDAVIERLNHWEPPTITIPPGGKFEIIGNMLAQTPPDKDAIGITPGYEKP